MAVGHVGSDPRLVDEREPVRFQIDQAREGVPVLLQHAAAVLLNSMASLFYASSPTDKEAMKSGNRDGQADFDQRLPQFLNRDVLARFPNGKDACHTLLVQARSHVSAL